MDESQIAVRNQFLGRKDVVLFQETAPYIGEILECSQKYKIEWNYLDNETHEENQAEEFDTMIVRLMLETVIRLDKAIDNPQV